MTEERIARLNELARKSKTIGLTEEEKQEQATLRLEYLASIRQSLEAQLDNVYFLEKDGTKTEADYLEYGYNDKQVILKQYVLGADGTWKLNPHFGNDGNVMAEKVADGVTEAKTDTLNPTSGTYKVRNEAGQMVDASPAERLTFTVPNSTYLGGGKVAVLTDIQGLEDFLGDMDFKVAGTMNGITAIQMDIKIKGIDEAILRQALSQALDGRLFILGKMLEVLPQPREHLSAYAPKIIRFTINPDKIREVIGPGGKMINKIIDETGVKIDIDDDGSVYIATPDEAAAAKARRIIEGIAKDIEVGEVYTGKVVRMMNFGVFVELLPGKDGMVHISKLAKGRVEKCEDVVKIGDELEVKVAEIDSQGRINLVRNDIEYDNAEMPRRSAPGQRPPRRDANRR